MRDGARASQMDRQGDWVSGKPWTPGPRHLPAEASGTRALPSAPQHPFLMETVDSLYLGTKRTNPLCTHRETACS